MKTVRIEGFEDMQNFLKDKYEKSNSRWNVSVRKFWRDELEWYGSIAVKIARNKAPYKSGELRRRIDYTVSAWNKLEVFIEEPEDDVYGVYQNNGFFNVKAQRNIPPKQFLEAGVAHLPTLLSQSSKDHWYKFWKIDR